MLKIELVIVSVIEHLVLVRILMMVVVIHKMVVYYTEINFLNVVFSSFDRLVYALPANYDISPLFYLSTFPQLSYWKSPLKYLMKSFSELPHFFVWNFWDSTDCPFRNSIGLV
jgi:hypothetical protein